MIRDTLTKIIEKSQAHVVDEPRDYIGASIIGSECLRQIWYEFKGFTGEGWTPKSVRTLNIGKRLEGLVIDWIKKAGIEVKPLTAELIARNVPVFRGHVDAVIVLDFLTHILEIKTAKDASFKRFVSKGLKLWEPEYYAQVQSYMGMSGIVSTYTLVLNKDTSELSDEFVLFDEDYYKKLEDKALMISRATLEPPRINGSPLFYKCKMCKFNKECHK